MAAMYCALVNIHRGRMVLNRIKSIVKESMYHLICNMFLFASWLIHRPVFEST